MLSNNISGNEVGSCDVQNAYCLRYIKLIITFENSIENKNLISDDFRNYDKQNFSKEHFFRKNSIDKNII